MSIKASLSSDGLEEVFTPPTLKEMCLYKCLTNKDILTREVEKRTNGRGKLLWEKFRLKETIQRELVEALLDAGEEYLFMLTPKYEPVLAAIRMSQPEHLVKVHVSNTYTLEDRQLGFLLSGGNVKSLDIHGCGSLRRKSLDTINMYGRKLEYLRIGDSGRILPIPKEFCRQKEKSAILRTPNLKTFIVSTIYYRDRTETTNYWGFLLQDFISNLEDLQITDCQIIQNLKVLEPTKNKLSSLSLRNCKAVDKYTWASVFKLHKLRILDLVGTSFGYALRGENVVQRLLTVMPNLTRLVVDSYMFKDFYVKTPIRGQESVAKRLEFFGIMENDVAVFRKAKLLANDVAYFGIVEGELRILEYLSDRRVNCKNYDSTLEKLLGNMIEVAQTPPWKSVSVISLLMKTFKHKGIPVVSPRDFLDILQKLLSPELLGKLGEVLLDQCIGVIFAMLNIYYWDNFISIEPRMIIGIIDIMMILDAELRLDHYLTLVPMVMRVTKKMLTVNVLRHIDFEDFKIWLKKTAQLLEKAVDRFLGEINVLREISSVLFIMKDLRDLRFSYQRRLELVEIFSNIFATLWKMCLFSGAGRAAFHSARRLGILMDLLKEFVDGDFGFAEDDSYVLLKILQSILQDTELKLKLSESRMIASGLENLLISVHSNWKGWKYSMSPDAEIETTLYYKLQGVASLLNSMEYDPRYDYKASAAVKEMLVQLE